MLIKDILFALNNGKSEGDLAKELGMSLTVFKNKLRNAAIELDDVNKKWNYYGSDEEKSLDRDITKTVKVLGVDRAFVDRHKQSVAKVDNAETKDSKYELFKDYINMNNQELLAKKTFTLTEEIYDTIKGVSKKNSMKINVLINLLLERGLHFYNVPIEGKTANKGKEIRSDEK
ncbi:hypothetical protein [Bacillus sp. PS06]|uniref:hypothetical protein n=1 Tax=Bacillus sp. PS06 TaxID=2764176 RepID=UPI001783332F|nr:hypothetical protein [Bacillus sp. PS06]MBD8070010.1 hypothetical protein [Bacillus sp. PS06]